MNHHNPQHQIGTCGKCGGEMVYNVPRLGANGGYIHKATGKFQCDLKRLASESRLERNRRFFVAVMLAAIYGMQRFTWREIATALRMIFVAMTSRRGKASDEIYEERMATCRACPLYYTPLSTCGSPLAEKPELGCWCQMERKARIAKAKCWMREKTEIDYGWKR